jgi:predicted phosphodiesterase
MMRITKNSAQCVKCGDIIESKDRHDFVYCSCQAIFVDGGLDYIRHGGNREDLINLSEYEEK